MFRISVRPKDALGFGRGHAEPVCRAGRNFIRICLRRENVFTTKRVGCGIN